MVMGVYMREKTLVGKKFAANCCGMMMSQHIGERAGKVEWAPGRRLIRRM